MSKRLENLEAELKSLPQDLSPLKVAEVAIPICQKHIVELQANIKSRHFNTQKAEINFFKTIKPPLVAKLIYYVSIYNIESEKPLNPKQKLKHYRRHLKRINQFVKDNIEFCNYIHQNETYLDSTYFVRNATTLPIIEAHYYLLDPDFSTSHDYKLAQVLAYDKLIIFLKHQISKAKQSDIENYPPTFEWNYSKTDLVEWIYAFHALKAVNNKQHQQADLNDLVQYFSESFGVEIPNIHRTYIEIKTRSNPTKFLDMLREALLNRIDEEMGN